MKILVNALHTTTGGGLVYLNKVMYQLAIQPWRVTVLCQAHMVDQLDVPEGWHVVTVPSMGFLKLHIFEQFKLPFLMRRLKIDVAWCNANYIPLLSACSIPTLHTNADVSLYAQGWRARVYWKVLRLLTRLSMLRARRVLTVAPYLITQYGGRLGKKDVLASPGVDVQHLPHERDKNLIVAVGDVYVQKNYPLLLHAFARLKEEMPDAHLRMIGRPVDEEEMDVLSSLVEELGLADRVTLPSPLSHEETLAWIQNAQVVALPSTVESFSMVMVEAMGCGTPVVALDVPCQREAGGNAAVYVPQTGINDAVAYAMALYSVMTNETFWDMFHRQGLTRAQMLTWDKTADAFVSIVEDFI